MGTRSTLDVAEQVQVLEGVKKDFARHYSFHDGSLNEELIFQARVREINRTIKGVKKAIKGLPSMAEDHLDRVLLMTMTRNPEEVAAEIQKAQNLLLEFLLEKEKDMCRTKKSKNRRIRDIETFYAPDQVETEDLRQRLVEQGYEFNDPVDRETLIDTCYERQSEYGLCFDYASRTLGNKGGYYRYQLSWGGPQEEFRFFVDPDGFLRRVEFWYLDWGTGERIVLKDKEFALLKGVFEFFQEIGMTHIEK